jgi:hypothetical protein
MRDTVRDTDTPRNGITIIDTQPADDLADVWDALDTLPHATPAVDLTTTTVELVAARATNEVGARTAPPSRWTDRAIPLAIILGSLVLGIVGGWYSRPDPDQRILERLPVIEHLSLLQEAGSVEFLEALAEQMKEGKGSAPRWMRLLRNPDELRAEAHEFAAAVQSLRNELLGDESSRVSFPRRRAYVESLSASDITALQRSAETFEELSAVDRRDLERVAAALADPARGSLRDAAKLWHVIVAANSPLLRRSIVAMPSAERIEWLARTAGRFEPRMPSRGREEDRGGDRRPPAPRGEGVENQRGNDGRPGPFQWQPPGHGTTRNPNGRPSEGPPPTSRGPSISRPGPSPPPAPEEAPSETQAAPR